MKRAEPTPADISAEAARARLHEVCGISPLTKIGKCDAAGLSKWVDALEDMGQQIGMFPERAIHEYQGVDGLARHIEEAASAEELEGILLEMAKLLALWKARREQLRGYPHVAPKFIRQEAVIQLWRKTRTAQLLAEIPVVATMVETWRRAHAKRHQCRASRPCSRARRAGGRRAVRGWI